MNLPNSMIFLLLASTSILANPVLPDDFHGVATGVVQDVDLAKNKEEVLGHVLEEPLKDPIYVPAEGVGEHIKSLPVDVPDTLQKHKEFPTAILENKDYKVPALVESTQLGDKTPLKSLPLNPDLVETTNLGDQTPLKQLPLTPDLASVYKGSEGAAPSVPEQPPKIVVTPPDSEPASPTYFGNQLFQKVNINKFQFPVSPQTGFDHFQNTFQIQKLPLRSPSDFFGSFGQNNPGPKPQPTPLKSYGPYEQEFEERCGGRQGKFSQSTILSSEALQITKLIGELKQALKSTLIEFVEEDSMGKNAVQVCKISQGRFLLNGASNDFLGNIGHFVKLDSADGDIDCRYKAYRALRTLEDALAGIRNDLPDWTFPKLDKIWTQLSDAISGTLNALTRRA